MKEAIKTFFKALKDRCFRSYTESDFALTINISYGNFSLTIMTFDRKLN